MTAYQPIDSGILWSQISMRAKMALGMVASNVVYDTTEVIIPIQGFGPYRKVIVRLNGADEYDLEYGRMQRRTLDWIVVNTMTGVQAERLSESLLELVEEVR